MLVGGAIAAIAYPIFRRFHREAAAADAHADDAHADGAPVGGAPPGEAPEE
jgi:hypothetical protein